MKKEFGMAIKKLREETGLSQEKFALSIGMDRTYYASVEAGKRNISLQNICKIAEGFGLSVSALFVVAENYCKWGGSEMDYVENIKKSGLTIYDFVSKDNNDLYIPIIELESILDKGMRGFSVNGLALRTRSKVVKSEICRVLGYPVPSSFKKTQPRFLGQNFDTYIQETLNVQIWNEPVDPERRYVFLRVNEEKVISRVKVITGAELVKYDRTGTLTQKYQATMTTRNKSVLFSKSDTSRIDKWATDDASVLIDVSPNIMPKKNQLLRIASVYSKLLPMVGKSIDYLDAVQERNRGAELHKMICEHLGYSNYEDDGSYPDLVNQLIEIKLQTSPTIDLGLHSPEDGADVVVASGATFKSEDIRYVVFEGEVNHDKILLKYLYLVNGKDFTEAFPLFKGKGTNAKLQLPLPNNFFD